MFAQLVVPLSALLVAGTSTEVVLTGLYPEVGLTGGPPPPPSEYYAEKTIRAGAVLAVCWCRSALSSALLTPPLLVHHCHSHL
jgi:hypothetical protein